MEPYKILFFVYAVNLALLVMHEMDSAYWKEWEMLGKFSKIGVSGFIALHFPLLIFCFTGMIFLYEGRTVGLIISFIISLVGLFAYFFHAYHLKRDNRKFNTTISKTILFMILIFSVLQFILSLLFLI